MNPNPFILAMMKRIKEEFNDCDLYSMGNCFAINGVIFTLREYEIFALPNGISMQFDIANPSFDPECVIRWIQKCVNSGYKLLGKDKNTIDKLLRAMSLEELDLGNI